MKGEQGLFGSIQTANGEWIEDYRLCGRAVDDWADKFGQAVCVHGEAGICLECPVDMAYGARKPYGSGGHGAPVVPAKLRGASFVMVVMLPVMLALGLWNGLEGSRSEQQQEQRIEEGLEDFLEQCLAEPVAAAGCPGPPGPVGPRGSNE